MKIYTRTGDNGTTSLIGRRVSKSSNVVKFLGKLDELNCLLGLIKSYIIDEEISSEIIILQTKIFEVSSVIAGVKIDLQLIKFIEKLELDIDNWTSELPELRNFILPGGAKSAGFAHLARSICRECERLYFEIKEIESNEQLKIENDAIGKFLNRLSDWLFTFARFLNKKEKVNDILWSSDNQ
jgi:cob(I)alamin adenosyltransferase